MQDTYKLSFWMKDGSKVGLDCIRAYCSQDAEKFAREIIGDKNITALAEYPTRIDEN